MIEAQAMAPWHAMEWGFFILANVIIFYLSAALHSATSGTHQ
jgi:hypothetical protein